MVEITAKCDKEKDAVSVRNKTEGGLADVMAEGLSVINSVYDQMESASEMVYKLFMAEAGLMLSDRIRKIQGESEPDTAKGGDAYAS